MKSGKAATSGGSANAEQVKAVQQALKDQGHDPGEVDGKMGPKTQAALRDYQQKQGLKATGRLDSETMAKLGVDSKTSSAGASSSPAASPSTTPSSSDTGAKSNGKADTGMKSDSKSDGKADTSAKPDAAKK
jgi:peptidoglycan hydrolase-like protein with peptidoglycan-binding domain